MSLKATLCAMSLMLMPGLALAQVAVGDEVGTSPEAIREALTAAGYTVEEIDMEENGMEADARLDGQLFWIEIGTDGLVRDIDQDGQ